MRLRKKVQAIQRNSYKRMKELYVSSSSSWALLMTRGLFTSKACYQVGLMDFVSMLPVASTYEKIKNFNGEFIA